MTQATAPTQRAAAPQPTFRTAMEILDLVEAWREDAGKLDEYGNPQQAQTLRRCADALEQVSPEYTTFVDETGARMRSGISANQFVRLARRFLGTPHVRVTRQGGRTFYRVRACLLPPVART